MRIVGLPLLSDNYAWVLAPDAGGACAVVDPSEAEPVRAFLQAEGLALGWILATHHHFDHTGGIEGLVEAFPDVEVLCSEPDRARVPGATRTIADGETVDVAGETARALYVPGHTTGAVAWHLEAIGAVFTGDTLFTAGCGRLFEGTPEQMHASLARLAALPDRTRVYCGHEYTVSNLKFAAALDPGDDAVRERLAAETARRAAGEPTVPATLSVEKRTNPFLRAGEAAMMRILGEPEPVAAFAEMRRRKDTF
jgi:hydroxyacylglutathione hydrolase